MSEEEKKEEPVAEEDKEEEKPKESKPDLVMQLIQQAEIEANRQIIEDVKKRLVDKFFALANARRAMLKAQREIEEIAFEFRTELRGPM